MQTDRWVAVVFVALALLGGCDGARAVQHDDGAVLDGRARDGRARDGRARDGAVRDLALRLDTRARDARLGDAADPRCVIAYRYTANDGCCCMPRVAVEAAAVAADPCLAEVPANGLLQPTAPGCAFGCHLACDCMAPDAPSRVAGWRHGRCEFAGECTTASDCQLATDTRSCCACPEAFPRSVVASDPCLVTGNIRGTVASLPCSPSCNWLCPTAGPCVPAQPRCDITAKLPAPEKICIGF